MPLPGSTMLGDRNEREERMPRLGFLSDWFRTVAPPTADGELLSRFTTGKDESVFAELVERHGPLVYRVCRRIVGQHHDAEDAFQATFLILAQKAGRIERPELLGNWLYGVAVKVASKARQRTMKRTESQRATMPEPVAASSLEPSTDLAAVIDTELAALPTHYRDAILLCDVQSLSRTAAAERLGIPEGTLSSRLNLGRKKLAARLTKRGITAPVIGVTTFLTTNAVTFALPDGLKSKTLATVSAWLTGGNIPIPILDLTTTGVRTMRIAMTFAATAIVTATSGFTVMAWQQKPAGEAVQAPPSKTVPVLEQVKDVKEEAKPIEGFRTKRVKVINLDYPARTRQWLPDGKTILAINKNSIQAINLLNNSKNHFRLSSINVQCTQICQNIEPLIPKNNLKQHRFVFAAVVQEQGKINSERFVEYVSPTLNFEYYYKPEDANQNRKLLTYEEYDSLSRHRIDNNDDVGEIISIMPDGKRVLCREVSGQTTTFTLLSLSDPSKIIARRILEGGKSIAAVSPDGKYFVTCVVQSVNKYPVAILEVSDIISGNRLWVWKGQATMFTLKPFSILISPDSQKVLVQLPVMADKIDSWKVERAYTRLFELAKQCEPVIIRDTAGSAKEFHSYSHDGRLLAGSCIETLNNRTISRLTIWDTATGTVVKSWEGNAIGAFSPSEPKLAILETTKTGERTNDFVSTIGIYDFSGYTK